MATSSSTVDDVFSRLIATYGRRFLDQWPGLQLSAVKAIWSRELWQIQTRVPHAVAWALDNLPEHPVNAIEFRNLCRQAPAQQLPRLAEPKAQPARVAAALAKLGSARGEVCASAADGARAKDRANIERLIESGRKLTLAQREMARTILGGDQGPSV